MRLRFRLTQLFFDIWDLLPLPRKKPTKISAFAINAPWWGKWDGWRRKELFTDKD